MDIPHITAQKQSKQEEDVFFKDMATGSCNKAYKTLKTIIKTSQLEASVIADVDGNLLTENAAVLSR
ncbi:hypothetical protein DPMN_060533 [Dreissena polymorpha]|uniref:Uncharacterized protein n=1 Tax=Dreissena polymorpha TaxID=45954 RepID=A0A9D4HHM6_DREPO|nr:hypothetical protein DPMN_060533 [Dreissena polymorpha]